MVTLADLKAGESVKIINVKADKDLKQRLGSFGVRKNSIVKVVNHSIAKSTIEIEGATTKIALRAQEAKEIEVEAL